nr:hypothetical protein [uncultured Bacteroides sp.]
MGKHISPYRLVSDSNALMALLTAICSFMFFKDLKIPYNRFINTVGASTFGVLLIHANSDTMRQWLWKDIVNCAGHYDTAFFRLYAFISILIIFFACIVIDYIRINTVEKIFFKYLDKIIRK